MILRDRVDVYEVTGVEEVMDPVTFEITEVEQVREWATNAPAYFGRADGMARTIPVAGTGWLADDEAVVILDPIEGLPASTPTAVKVRHRGRVWVVMAVRTVMRGGRPHHVSLRLKTSR